MSASPIRRRAPRALVLAAASLILLGGCSAAQRAPSSYDGAKDNFIDGCKEIASSDNGKDDDSGQSDTTKIESPSKYCACIFAAISSKNGVPYSEFKKIQSELQDTGGPLPESYLSVIEKSTCDPSSATGKKAKSTSTTTTEADGGTTTTTTEADRSTTTAADGTTTTAADSSSTTSIVDDSTTSTSAAN